MSSAMGVMKTNFASLKKYIEFKLKQYSCLQIIPYICNQKHLYRDCRNIERRCAELPHTLVDILSVLNCVLGTVMKMGRMPEILSIIGFLSIV